MNRPFLTEQDIAAFSAILDNPLMTVVAAMKCEDYLLLSADGEAAEAGDLKMTINKTRQLPDLKLAWGTCGDDAASGEFSEWLELNAKDIVSNWNTFQGSALDKLNAINNYRVKMIQNAGTPNQLINRDTVCASALITGHIGGKFEILDLGNNGQFNFVRCDRFWAIGGIGPISRTIYYALRENSFSYDIPNMKKIMKMTIGIARLAGDPVRILKISATGIESIQQPRDFLQAPYMTCYSRLHGGRNP